MLGRIGIFAAALWLGSAATAAAAARPPNVVVILADDLGYGDLGAYGASKVATPNIDRLAEEGRRFTDAHSPASVCSPSRYNLMTGRYAWRTWNRSGTVWATDPLLIEEDRLTLADLFQAQGYETTVIGKWHLGFGSPETPGWDEFLGPDYNRDLVPGPLEVGFDYAWVFPHTGQRPHFIIENHRVLNLDPANPIRIKLLHGDFFAKPYQTRPRNGTAQDVEVEGGGPNTFYSHKDLSDMITRRAVDWIGEQSAEKPFFLYFAHRNPHTPVIPHPRFAGTSEIGPYGDFLHELDWSVGEVLKALDEKGLAANTLVVFASDNGGIADYFNQTRSAEIMGHKLNGPLRGQKTDAYEGGHRVPLIVRWPGVAAPGSESGALVALTDFLATFADYFDVALPDTAGEDSFSFLPAITGEGASARTTLVADAFTGVMSIRKGDWKLILAQHGGGVPTQNGVEPDPDAPPGQLFNLADDLSETNNLYAKHPEKVAELTALLKKIQDEGRSVPKER